MKLSENYRIRRIADESVIIPILASGKEKPDIYAVNEMSSLILDYIIAGKKVEEIISLIEAEYEVSHEEVEGDVHRFIDYLVSHGIVEE